MSILSSVEALISSASHTYFSPKLCTNTLRVSLRYRFLWVLLELPVNICRTLSLQVKSSLSLLLKDIPATPFFWVLSSYNLHLLFLTVLLALLKSNFFLEFSSCPRDFIYRRTDHGKTLGLLISPSYSMLTTILRYRGVRSIALAVFSALST